jgi:hypothetical protein
MSDNEDKLNTALSLGMAAAAELGVLAKAFEAVKSQYTDGWLLSDPRDDAGREKLWVATTILSRVEHQLRQYVSDGKVAERNIEELRKAGEPKKRSLFSS